MSARRIKDGLAAGAVEGCPDFVGHGVGEFIADGEAGAGYWRLLAPKGDSCAEKTDLRRPMNINERHNVSGPEPLHEGCRVEVFIEALEFIGSDEKRGALSKRSDDPKAWRRQFLSFVHDQDREAARDPIGDRRLFEELAAGVARLVEIAQLEAAAHREATPPLPNRTRKAIDS
jgi:hypothetical protein